MGACRLYIDISERREEREVIMKEITCKQCGVLAEINDMISVGNEYLCIDCYAHDYFTCEQCGKVHSLSDCNTVNSGTDDEIYVCNNCIDLYNFCDSCSNYFSDEYIWAEDGGTHICTNCSDDYLLCDECGDIINADTAHYDDGCYFCDACFREHEFNDSHINEYSYKPIPIFLGDGKLYMGVELEVDNGSNLHRTAQEICSLTDDVYLKYDGSLDDTGFEIVSHPATLEYHLNNLAWKKISELCLNNNYRSHEASTCGLHVHVNRTYFGAEECEQDLNIAKLIILINRWWDKYIVPFSRRSYSQLDRWAAKPNVELSEADTENEIIDKIKLSKSTGRYQGINLLNECTVEFRIFRGTLKVSTLYATLQFVETICQYAKSKTLSQICSANWHDMFPSNCNDELAAYLKIKNLI